MKKIRVIKLNNLEKAVKGLNDILEEYWDKPGIYISYLCRKHNLNYDNYMNELLDHYNLILHQEYKKYGEDITLPSCKKLYWKESLYYTFQIMAEEWNNARQTRRNLFELDFR